jgi:hypothetical protein
LAEIRRSSAGPRLRLETEEVQLLTRLADDVDRLLSGGAEEDGATRAPGARPDGSSVDPLSELTGLDWPDAEQVTAPTDPALRRLLPDAYRDDEEAAADFRRYTDAALREGKRADATVVRQGLASIAVTGERVLDDAQTQAWLRFLTDARLVLASRLGVDDADDVDALQRLPVDDPRLAAAAVYDWLLEMLAELLAAIGAG